jgi:hypothetical protein
MDFLFFRAHLRLPREMAALPISWGKFVLNSISVISEIRG